ncbi:MAG: Acetyltransferase domain protein [Acidobacteria bacterium]|nr:Acetyltransferase domain protein [Acidobacteriota bacterium]
MKLSPSFPVSTESSELKTCVKIQFDVEGLRQRRTPIPARGCCNPGKPVRQRWQLCRSCRTRWESFANAFSVFNHWRRRSQGCNNPGLEFAYAFGVISRAKLWNPLLKFLIVVVSILSCWPIALGQSCVTREEVMGMISRLNTQGGGPPNDKLRSEFLKLRTKDDELLQVYMTQPKQKDARLKLDQSRAKNSNRLCEILKQFGWPTISLVGPDGAAAAFSILQNSPSYALQIDLMPLVVAAVKKNELDKPHFAAYFDRMRMRVGMMQYFGTQASLVNGLLVLVPIEAEAQLGARRGQMDLPPMADYLRSLEQMYRTPVIRSPFQPPPAPATGSDSLSQKSLENLVSPEPADDVEVLRIETNLVSLNVSVYNNKLGTHVGTLDQKDFSVLEDGQQQTISFFAATDVPFDLALLIDLSGSTSDKRDLIRKTTRRFIEAARPGDRLAIITFSNAPEVVAPLTADHAQLLSSLKKIDATTGSSNVWDAVKFALDQVMGSKSLDRRRAVVLMSDGVDNDLGYYGKGSRISFSDLLESVRHSDVMLIPIYLDTETDRQSYPRLRQMYENARRTMALLAEESGGLYYKARKVDDLNGVYEQVLNDLGKVYSLGYKPTNEKRDGSWRVVKIQTPTHPEVTTRSRPGHYAN